MCGCSSPYTYVHTYLTEEFLARLNDSRGYTVAPLYVCLPLPQVKAPPQLSCQIPAEQWSEVVWQAVYAYNSMHKALVPFQDQSCKNTKRVTNICTSSASSIHTFFQLLFPALWGLWWHFLTCAERLKLPPCVSLSGPCSRVVYAGPLQSPHHRPLLTVAAVCAGGQLQCFPQKRGHVKGAQHSMPVSWNGKDRCEAVCNTQGHYLWQ